MPESEPKSADQALLPPKIRELLHRKLTFRRRKFEQDLIHRKTAIYANLRERIEALAPERTKRPSRRKIFRETFTDLQVLAIEATQEWARIAWKTILETLEATQRSVSSIHEIQEFLDSHVWPGSTPLFALRLVDPNGLQATMDQILGDYGLPGCDAESHFKNDRNHAVAEAEVAIRNATRGSREQIKLQIEEYLTIGSDQTTGDKKESNSALNQSDNSVRKAGTAGKANDEFPCLPNLPQKRNNFWAQVIKVATKEFWKKHERCPDSAELWSALTTDPPRSFDLAFRLNDRGEEAIHFNTDSLGKAAFLRRFRDYSGSTGEQ